MVTPAEPPPAAPGLAAPGAVEPDVVLRARSVDLVRGGRLLLDQVTFTARAGQLWALLGPNGAGKSSLLRVLATYAHPTRGQVEILGRRLGQVNVFELRPLIGHVSVHHPLATARTVREVVLTGATGTIEPAARWTPEAAQLRRADELVRLLGLAGLAGARWPVLSQGERARALIARGLMPRPRVLLLDEPSAGLDLGGREQLLASLDELREHQPGLATIMVTHHLEELPASTSHALLLRAGAMIAAGPAGDVLTTELVSACFGHPVVIARRAGRWTAAADGSRERHRQAGRPGA